MSIASPDLDVSQLAVDPLPGDNPGDTVLPEPPANAVVVGETAAALIPEDVDWSVALAGITSVPVVEVGREVDGRSRIVFAEPVPVAVHDAVKMVLLGELAFGSQQALTLAQSAEDRATGVKESSPQTATEGPRTRMRQSAGRGLLEFIGDTVTAAISAVTEEGRQVINITSNADNGSLASRLVLASGGVGNRIISIYGDTLRVFTEATFAQLATFNNGLRVGAGGLNVSGGLEATQGPHTLSGGLDVPSGPFRFRGTNAIFTAQTTFENPVTFNGTFTTKNGPQAISGIYSNTAQRQTNGNGQIAVNNSLGVGGIDVTATLQGGGSNANFVSIDSLNSNTIFFEVRRLSDRMPATNTQVTLNYIAIASG